MPQIHDFFNGEIVFSSDNNFFKNSFDDRLFDTYLYGIVVDIFYCIPFELKPE